MSEPTKHISQLKSDPKNARKHNPRNIGMIEKALGEVGAARSIVIDENNVVLAGNGVLEAAGNAGIEKVQVVDADGETIVAVRRSGLTPEQKAKLALYDNRTAELAEWDTEVLATLADEIELGELFTAKELFDLIGNDDNGRDPGADMDMAEQLQEKWKVQSGQLWLVGRHRLFCGDSTNAENVRQLLGGGVPNLMVTDPPYGIEYDPGWRARLGINMNAGKMGAVTNDDRADWREAWALFPGNVIYCWHAAMHASEVEASLNAAGFQAVTQIVWNKDRFAISRGDYHWKHEPCWYAVRKGQTHSWTGGRDQCTVWDIARADDSGHGHSTQKPVECMARPIRNHEGDVYDPFIGSGTTIVAAEQTGRVCYGMELEPKYVSVALQRLTDMGLTAQLVDGDSKITSLSNG